jgi:uncharacterized membrane protein
MPVAAGPRCSGCAIPKVVLRSLDGTRSASVQWRIRIGGVWDDLRDSLWLLPTVVVAAAAALAGLLIAVEPSSERTLWRIVFSGTPDGARALLSELAGATITVVGLVFSLTVIALQMASSQFTPRLLRTFLRDRGVQTVLSVMIASAVFDVIVLSTVRSSGEGVEPFVPRLAVTAALILAGTAVALLVYFLHHVTQNLRVDVIIRSISHHTMKQLEAIPADRSRLPDQEPPVPDGDTFTVVAHREGYLQLVDAQNLARSLRDVGYRLRLRPTVGEWVSRGTTLAWAWVDGSDTRARPDDLDDTVHRCVHLGADRMEFSDLTFGIRQLQDIALRALSTGINDPSTASIVITQLSSILVYMADEPLGSELLTDDDGQVRVAVPRPTFAAYLDLVIGPLRHNAGQDLRVLLSILQLLTDVAERVADSADRADAVRHQLGRLLASADLPDADEADQLERAARVVTDTLSSGRRPVTAAPTRAS